MALRILVCAKQVPDSEKVKIDFKTGNLIRSSVSGVFNSDDLHALAAAGRIKNKYEDAEITVISMGPAEAKDVLFEAIARGADRGVLLSDRAFAGADTWATSNVLAAAAEKLGGFDIILAGKQASDGDTAQVGPQLAEKLGIPHLAYVKSIELSDDMKAAYAARDVEGGTEEDEITLPALFTCAGEIAEPGYIKMKGIFASKDITVWNADDLGLDETRTGLSGSKTLVLGTYAIAPKQPGFMVPGANETEKVGNVIDMLKEKKYL